MAAAFILRILLTSSSDALPEWLFSGVQAAVVSKLTSIAVKTKISGSGSEAFNKLLCKVSYQGGAYRSQLESAKPAYPVIGIVLDWTSRTSQIPFSLGDLLSQEGAAADEVGLADEMKLQVFHMRNLPEEMRKRFTSDMGFVVDYCLESGQYTHNAGHYIGWNQTGLTNIAVNFLVGSCFAGKRFTGKPRKMR